MSIGAPQMRKSFCLKVITQVQVVRIIVIFVLLNFMTLPVTLENTRFFIRDGHEVSTLIVPFFYCSTNKISVTSIGMLEGNIRHVCWMMVI